MCTSALCMVHCLAIPLVLILGVEGVLQWIDHEWIEQMIIGFSMIIGLVAFGGGYLRHRQHFVPVLFVAGMLLIVNGESVSHEWLGLTLSLFGASIIIYAHYNNHLLRSHAVH